MILKRKLLPQKKIVKPKINWGESKKRRQELIAQGILPYEVIERDKNNKVIKDN